MHVYIHYFILYIIMGKKYSERYLHSQIICDDIFEKLHAY